MESVLRYVGKRYMDLSYELGEFGITRYCEPFSGSFNVGFGIDQSKYNIDLIINDLDFEIYNFWNELKTNYTELYTNILELNTRINNHRFDDDKKREIWLMKTSDDLSKRAAAEFIIKQYTGLHGLSFNREKIIDNGEIYKAHLLLQKCNIKNLNYRDIIAEYDSQNTLWYIDPPYDIPNVSNYYRCDSSFFYHRELREVVDKIKGKWIMTYNNSEYIKYLYSKYNKYTISKAMFSGVYKELLITNYDKPLDTIDGYIDANNQAFVNREVNNIGFDATGF